MASKSTIGALRVILGADTAIWQKNLKQANRGLAGFAKNAKVHAAAAAAAFTAAAAAFGAAVKSTINHADKLGKLSQSIGVPVEALSALQHAAEQSNVTVDELGRSFRNVARNMQGAARAPTDFSRALDALGVSWRNANGNFRRADKLMLAVADTFAGMQDGAGKTALAMKIFGEEMGPRLVPLLNQGSAAIRRMMGEAKVLGLTISGDAARHAASFNDSMTRLSAGARGVATSITTALLPTLDLFGQHMARIATRTRRANGAFSLANAFGKGLAAVYLEISLHARNAASAIARLAEAQRKLFALDPAGALAAVRNITADWAANTAEARKQLAGLSAAASEAKEVFGPFRHEMTLTFPPLTHGANQVAAAFRAANADAMALFSTIVNAPTETFAAKMAAAENAVRQGTIGFRQFSKVMDRLHKENANNMHDLASATSSALTTIFKDSKGAAIAAAVINTAQGITRNLAQYPQPFAAIMAGITAASGAAQIAAIKSAGKGGGGSAPSVSGGGGGTEPAAALPSHTMTVQGINPTDIFTGDMMRGFAERLLQYQRDGGMVVLE